MPAYKRDEAGSEVPPPTNPTHSQTNEPETAKEESQSDARALSPVPPAHGPELDEVSKNNPPVQEIPPADVPEVVKEDNQNDAPALGSTGEISQADRPETVKEVIQNDAPALGSTGEISRADGPEADKESIQNDAPALGSTGEVSRDDGPEADKEDIQNDAPALGLTGETSRADGHEADKEDIQNDALVPSSTEEISRADADKEDIQNDPPALSSTGEISRADRAETVGEDIQNDAPTLGSTEEISRPDRPETIEEDIQNDASALGSTGEISRADRPEAEDIQNDAPALGSTGEISRADRPETEDIQNDAPALGSIGEISRADDSSPTSKQLHPLGSDSAQTSAKTDDDPKTTYSDPKTPRRDAFWKKLGIFFPKFRKPSQQSKPDDDESADELGSPSRLEQAIEEDISFTKMGEEMLKTYQQKLEELRADCVKLKDVTNPQMSMDDISKLKDDISKLKKDLIKLRLQIPLKHRKADAEGYLKNLKLDYIAKASTSQEVLEKMQLHGNSIFESSPEFKDFESRYNELESKLKLCLLCFSVFPEKTVIKKRMMVLWWIAEGYASESNANDYFVELIDKGFIEPVNENKSLHVGSCRMHPFYRSALGVLAKRSGFLNFDPKGEPTQNFVRSCQACLVGEGLISYDDLKNESMKVENLEKVHFLININESILEFKKGWFGKMKNINFLYLGRWSSLDTDHREVEDTVFLKDELHNMSSLKFLSLQGVSNVIDLPDSVLKLANLEILDIRACPNLETIPKRISLLKWLTHLDMSECYLLEQMPKALSSLKNLRVLKGFVVGTEPGKNTCTLDDLKELEMLIKLCIYTGLENFPDEKNVEALGNLTGLLKLTITWGGSAFRNNKDEVRLESKNGDTMMKKVGLPPNLEKLDLRYFPTSITPFWLELKSMKELQKLRRLYIRAGRFSDIGQYQDSYDWNWPLEKDTWKVEELRLRYLPEIEMEWRQLQELFPNLIYLEQVGCPKLTLFPCDANGVWMKKKIE